MAFANQCRAHDINFQTQCLFVAQDIDFTVGCMCYIAMSLMGCPGYVVNGDTLCNPNTTRDRHGLLPVDDSGRIWYTPMFMTSELWVGRRMAAAMDRMLSCSRSEEKPQETAPAKQKRQKSVVSPPSPAPIPPKPELPQNEPEPAYADNASGQLMFF